MQTLVLESDKSTKTKQRHFPLAYMKSLEITCWYKITSRTWVYAIGVRGIKGSQNCHILDNNVTVTDHNPIEVKQQKPDSEKAKAEKYRAF